MEREPAARAIAESAKQHRQPTPRWLWIAALAVSAICVGALAIGWLAADPTDAKPTPSHREPPASRGGFGAGLIVGFGAGIAAGGALWLRRR